MKTNIRYSRKWWLCLIFFVLFFGCNRNNNSVPQNDASSGNAVIYADESCRSILEAEKDIFESRYPKATLQLVFGDENFVLRKLQEDSTRLVCMSRALDSNEVRSIQSKSLSTESLQIAMDALVLLASVSRKDTFIEEKDLAKLLDKSNAQAIRFVVDKSQTGHVNYLSHKFKIPTNNLSVYALSTPDSVIQFLKLNATAIGIVPLAWLDQLTQEQRKETLSKLRVLAIKNQKAELTMPDQEHLYNESYSLSKGIYLNLKGRYNDVGTTFANFCVDEIGQMIVLKSSLLPARMPTREVQMATPKTGKTEAVK